MYSDWNFKLEINTNQFLKIWNLVGPAFKIYFEYLAIIESVWYEKKRSNLAGEYSKKTSQDNYIELCSSSYETNIRVRKPLNGQTTKFRLGGIKSARVIKPKRLTRDGFKVSRSVINCNYGIFMEDVFHE